MGSTPPLPQPLRPRIPTVERVRSKATRRRRRERFGRKSRNSPATLMPIAGDRWREPGTAAVRVARVEEAGAMVRTVLCELELVRLIEAGLNWQTAPEGRPPVQAKVTVD